MCVCHRRGLGDWDWDWRGVTSAYAVLGVHRMSFGFMAVAVDALHYCVYVMQPFASSAVVLYSGMVSVLICKSTNL